MNGESSEALASAIEYEVSRGWRVEAQATPTQVVLVRGKKVNHILHLLLSVVTLGLWLPVWFILSLTTNESRAVLTLHTDGTVTNSMRPAVPPGQTPVKWYQDSKTVAILAVTAVIVIGIYWFA